MTKRKIELSEVTRRKTNKGYQLFYHGRRLKREDYWNFKIKFNITNGRKLSYLLILDEINQKKLLILMKAFNINNPSATFKFLLNEYFTVFNVQRIRKKIKKRKKLK